MAVLPQTNYNLACTPAHMPKIANYGQKSCLTCFYTYIRGFNRFPVPKTWEKTPYMAVLTQKQKLQIWPQSRVPKMAKYGQKSCLAWFYTYIRGFNRFLVPKNIGKDILHGYIDPKTKIANLATIACAKNG